MTRDRAFEIAEELAVLDNFPKSPKAVRVVAELIFSLAKTDQQADWLRNELISGKYSKWQGPGWLSDIFSSRFPVAEQEKQHHFIATDCQYCGGSGWRVSKQVGLYTGVSRCDHNGLTPKPVRVERQFCKQCEGWGTVTNARGKHEYCACPAGQILTEETPEWNPRKWLELMDRLGLKAVAIQRKPEHSINAEKVLANMDKGYIDRGIA